MGACFGTHFVVARTLTRAIRSLHCLPLSGSPLGWAASLPKRARRFQPVVYRRAMRERKVDQPFSAARCDRAVAGILLFHELPTWQRTIGIASIIYGL